MNGPSSTALKEWTETLFSSKGWHLASSTDPLMRRFLVIAENEVAVVFSASCSAEELVAESQALGASIAAVMRQAGGEKSWEAYLVLFAPLLDLGDTEAAIQVQRDLTYCRRVVVDAERVVQAEDPISFLKSQLSFLFPLVIKEDAVLPDISTLMTEHLVARGNDDRTVAELVRNLDDPQFDAVAFMSEIVASRE